LTDRLWDTVERLVPETIAESNARACYVATAQYDGAMKSQASAYGNIGTEIPPCLIFPDGHAGADIPEDAGIPESKANSHLIPMRIVRPGHSATDPEICEDPIVPEGAKV
jgi:hypothetical protein